MPFRSFSNLIPRSLGALMVFIVLVTANYAPALTTAFDSPPDWSREAMTRLLASLRARGFSSDMNPKDIEALTRADMAALGGEMILWLRHTMVPLSEGEALALRMISREFSLNASGYAAAAEPRNPAPGYLADVNLRNALNDRPGHGDEIRAAKGPGEKGGKVSFEILASRPSKQLLRARTEAIPSSMAYGARAAVFFDRHWSLRAGVETWDDSKAFRDDTLGTFLDGFLMTLGAAPGYNYTTGYLKSLSKTLDLRYHILSGTGKLSTFVGLGYAGLDMELRDEIRLKDGSSLMTNKVEAGYGGADLIFGLEHYLSKVVSLIFESRYRIAKKRLVIDSSNLDRGDYGKLIPAPQYDDMATQYIDYFNSTDKIFENEGILLQLSLNLTFGN